MLKMKLRLTMLVVSLAMAVQAQMQMNVQQLADFVRSELALKQHSDKQIAAYIKKLDLTEKLTDKTITDLESQGAGPKTVEALQELRDKTASMKAPSHDSTYSPATAPDNTLKSGPATVTLRSKAPPIPPPDSIRQQKILDLMKQYALSYTENLPNFICVQVTRQYVDPNAGDHYRSIGNILAKVSYNEGREKYNVYSVNGQLINTSMEGVPMHGGAISTGEFGSLMREIFEPKSQAEFGWDHWATLRGRRMAVFNYFIDSGHSSWSISYSAARGDEQRIITAYKGLVYADENTGEINRIKFVAVDIPRSFPVTQATEILDYDAVDISGRQYICPLVARLFMRADRQSSKNEIEFRDYRKFGTESNITYDLDPNAPPPLPANKTEEQPAGHSSADTSTPAQAARPQQPAKPSQKGESGSNPWTLPTPPPPPPQQ
jgi:hypothetical protein